MKMVMTRFCSLRMTGEYADRYYIPAARRMGILLADDAREARSEAVQRQRLRSSWGGLTLKRPVRGAGGPYRVGDRFHVTADVNLGTLTARRGGSASLFRPHAGIRQGQRRAMPHDGRGG